MKVSRAYDAILDAFDRARVSGGGDLKNKDLDRYSLRHDVDHDISVALRLASMKPTEDLLPLTICCRPLNIGNQTSALQLRLKYNNLVTR